MSLHKTRQAGREEGGRGQALAEFALVIPILMIVFMGLIEVALAYNAVVGVNRASQNAAHLAAILGNQMGTDCIILQEIENDIYAPNERSKIQEVLVERKRAAGSATLAQQTWTRLTAGTEPCQLTPTTFVDLPYHLSVSTYPESQRCNVLKGCPSPPYAQQHSTVDNIGVSIRYRHGWATPLNAAFGFFGGGNTGWNILQTNVFRIEPVL
jgi:hypothetical protein